MAKIKFSVIFGFAVVLITGIAFTIDYLWLHGTLPGYKVLAYPGIVTLRLFSEELGFLNKMVILLFAQFVFYALVFSIIRKPILMAANRIR
jgi:hypothetical protein